MANGHVKVGGVWKALSALHVKVSGAWKEVDAGYIKVAGAWKKFYENNPLAVTASNVAASASDFSSSGRVPAGGFALTTCTPSGGTAPYTFAWTKLTTADGTAFTQQGATLQNNGWYGDPRRDPDDIDNTETWRVTVTDAELDTASHTISVTLTWTNIS